MKESCQNCKSCGCCLVRSLAIFNLFIVTGRDAELAECKDSIDFRGICGDQYERAVTAL